MYMMIDNAAELLASTSNDGADVLAFCIFQRDPGESFGSITQRCFWNSHIKTCTCIFPFFMSVVP